MQKKHEADILAEQIKKGKFKGKTLKIKITNKNRIEYATEEKQIIFNAINEAE